MMIDKILNYLMYCKKSKNYWWKETKESYQKTNEIGNKYEISYHKKYSCQARPQSNDSFAGNVGGSCKGVMQYALAVRACVAPSLPTPAHFERETGIIHLHFPAYPNTTPTHIVL